MQTNDIYNTCLDISNVLNAGDISNARSKVITLLHEINGTNNNSTHVFTTDYYSIFYR